MITEFNAFRMKSDSILNIEKDNIKDMDNYDTEDYWNFSITQIDDFKFDDDIVDQTQIKLLKHNIRGLIVRNKSNAIFLKKYPAVLDLSDKTSLCLMARNELKNSNLHYDSFIQKVDESLSHISFLLVMSEKNK